MILRIVLILSLLAMITTVLAAPPRFRGQRPDSQQQAKAKAKTDASAKTETGAKSTSAKMMDKGSPLKADKSSPAKKAKKFRMRKGHAVNAEPSITPADSTSTHVMSKKKQSFLGRLFNRKNTRITDERTYKQPDELINTENHHRTNSEKLGVADVHTYTPGLKDFWKVNASKVMCSMKQNINHYGHVEFRQGVGQPLEFALFVLQAPAGVGKAHIRIEPPKWRHFVQAKDLGVIEVEPGERAVTASEEWSRRLFMDMSEGLQPVLRYWDAADSSDDIEVFLSALNFQNSLDLFHRCTGQLLRYDYKSAKRSIVHFHADSSRLRAKAKHQLDEVLELLKEDIGIKQIDLELYTRSKGLVRYNFRLATRRARGIRDYLIRRGIDEDKLLIKIHTKRAKDLRKLGYKQTDVHIVLRRKVAK